jgi:hypothetical protein
MTRRSSASVSARHPPTAAMIASISVLAISVLVESLFVVTDPS